MISIRQDIHRDPDSRLTTAVCKLLGLMLVFALSAGCSELDEAEVTCDYEDCDGYGEEIRGVWVQRECQILVDETVLAKVSGGFAKSQLEFLPDGTVNHNIVIYPDEFCEDVEGSSTDVSGGIYTYATGDLIVDASGLLATKFTLNVRGRNFDETIITEESVSSHFFVSRAAGLCFTEQTIFGVERSVFSPSTLDGQLDLSDCYDVETR